MANLTRVRVRVNRGALSWSLLAWIAFPLTLATLVILEVQSAWLQSRVLAAAAAKATFSVEPGESNAIRFPEGGPFDSRLGYARIPEFSGHLRNAGFEISAQARSSEFSRKLADWHVFPIYREKIQAGLTVMDTTGEPLYAVRFPKRAYAEFNSIPPIVVNTLLFIENREMLDPDTPYRNPALEWDRLGRAVVSLSVGRLAGASGGGGSTLATQLEKVRHSPQGRTSSVGDKLRQMLSASLRAYQDGAETMETRKRIICDYINSVPLASVAGYGEVHGIGDGLWAWHDSEFEYINQILDEPETPASLPAKAKAYRQLLNLLVAVRKPANLQNDRKALTARADAFLPLLTEAQVISPALRDATLKLSPAYRRGKPKEMRAVFADHKLATTIRSSLLGSLSVNSLYELDRLDLTVQSTLDARATDQAAALLRKLNDPEEAAQAGLLGPKMLSADGASDVVYSFTLYENVGSQNLLRVQADNYGGPLNMNEGTMLELGSTAKLRTLATYLEIVADLHAKYANQKIDPGEEMLRPNDTLTRWAIGYLRTAPDHTLPAMLEAAMAREIPAWAGEGFFTGGGLHYFSNFVKYDASQPLPLRRALHLSVNLPFVRLLREVVNYHMYRKPGQSPHMLQDAADPARAPYLQMFSNEEAKQYLIRYHRKYRNQTTEQALKRLFDGFYPTPKRMTVVFRSTYPEKTVDELAEFLATRPTGRGVSRRVIESMFESYSPEKFGLRDLGYLADLHPLELWYLRYLRAHPNPGLGRVIADAAPAAKEIFEWLETANRSAQNTRLYTMLEREAFERIAVTWRRHGYPFPTLVPSLATALGSSGDNPAALAEFAGIVINGGMRYPIVKMSEVHFGSGTPVETLMRPMIVKGVRVMREEVAAVLRLEMIDVVEKGTAQRAFGSVVVKGRPIAVGGKTGTGDNRVEIHGPGGVLRGSVAKSRTASFVFTIGDRFFGTVVAYVPGAAAESHGFTSSLPVTIFRRLVPTFLPIIERPANSAPGTLRAGVGKVRTQGIGMSGLAVETSAEPAATAR